MRGKSKKDCTDYKNNSALLHFSDISLIIFVEIKDLLIVLGLIILIID